MSYQLSRRYTKRNEYPFALGPEGTLASRCVTTYCTIACTGQNNQAPNLAAQVGLFPNPARGSFTLRLPAELGRTPVTVKVVNQLGQLVRERTVPMTRAGATAQFDVSGFAPGVYLLRITGGSNQVVTRIVVE